MSVAARISDEVRVAAIRLIEAIDGQGYPHPSLAPASAERLEAARSAVEGAPVSVQLAIIASVLMDVLDGALR